jgi:hypothetical protein
MYSVPKVCEGRCGIWQDPKGLYVFASQGIERGTAGRVARFGLKIDVSLMGLVERSRRGAWNLKRERTVCAVKFEEAQNLDMSAMKHQHARTAEKECLR